MRLPSSRELRALADALDAAPRRGITIDDPGHIVIRDPTARDMAATLRGEADVAGPLHWVTDALAAVGLIALGTGIGWWLHPGAGLALSGACLLALGVTGAWR